MNKDFETIVMGTYAELCVMWRIAHVANRVQAEEFDAKLTSLEGVIKAFGLDTPEQAAQPAAQPAASSPNANQANANQAVPPRPRPASENPRLRAQQSPAEQQRAAAVSAGVILED